MKKDLHHLPPAAGRLRTHFQAPASPLHGKRIPMDWAVLDFRGKVRALVKVGYAVDWTQGCKLLGQHAAAVRKARKARKARTGMGWEGSTDRGPVDDLERRKRRASRWWDR